MVHSFAEKFRGRRTGGFSALHFFGTPMLSTPHEREKLWIRELTLWREISHFL